MDSIIASTYTVPNITILKYEIPQIRLAALAGEVIAIAPRERFEADYEAHISTFQPEALR